MNIYSSFEFLPDDIRTAVTIGKFDGLHIGHRRLMEALALKKKEGLKTAVIRFTYPVTDPAQHGLLLSEEDFVSILESFGTDYYFRIPVSQELFSLSKEEFLENILCGMLHTGYVVCGSDFTFGKNRSGNTAYLKEREKELGYVTEVYYKEEENGTEISSSRIRACLKEGKIEEADSLLGYRYSVSGPVVHGRKLARTLGFPTANVETEKGRFLPAYGVYAAVVLTDGQKYPAMLNFGVKPTVTEENLPLFEVYLPGVTVDLYGKNIRIEPLHCIRREKRFSSLEELKAQIENDLCVIRTYFGEEISIGC